MKKYINRLYHMLVHMAASLILKALALMTSLVIVTLAYSYDPAPPPFDPYEASIKLISGSIMAAGSLYLSYWISCTFLCNGGKSTFKALYWAALSSAGAGISEAASGLVAMSVTTGLLMASLAFAGAGVMTLHFSAGGA